MSQKYAKLFEPIQVGTLKLKNRFSMAPMGLVGYSDCHGGFNENAQEYYVERARGGTGLIITGICCVDYNEMPDLALPCPTKNPLMFGFSTKAMNERIHSFDSKILLQLTGGLGRSAMPGFFKRAIAPSKQQNRFDPSVTHEEMTIDEIHVLIQDFVKSAVIAKASGFDGVEIHAVHEGYLLDQFSMSFYNKRTDEYGGDLRSRLKIATDIVKGVKAACGADFPVSLRFSLKSFVKGLRQGALPGEEFVEQGKDIAEGIEAAKILVEAGYDMLNVDAGTYDSWYWNHPPMYFEKGMYREFGRILKKEVNVPIILAGRMDDPDIALDALNGCCDIIGYGRPLLADPYLPQKIKEERFEDIRPCLSCHDGCMGRIAHAMPLSCAVNPQCGREKERAITPAMQKKQVTVVGGGVAGMEAARICALRGHSVTLFEKGSKLGGNIVPGSVPDFKVDDRALIKWYETQLQKAGITVLLNKSADAAEIEKSDAEVVVIATGSTPISLDLGSENNVGLATQVLDGTFKAGDNIVVIGGGLVGCETGLWLSKQGKKVSVVEMQADILGGPHGMPFMNYDMLKDLLAANHIDVYKNSKVKTVNKDNVIVQTADKDIEISADTIITSVGFKSSNALFDELQPSNKVIYNVGDSRRVHNIMDAIWDANEVALTI